jgi:hypothetical protein
MAAAAAVLPPGAAGVAMKTPAVTAMAGAQTTINNQLNASTATATEMATTMTMETKATAAVEARQQHLRGDGQLSGGGGSLARAQGWRRRQRSGGVGSGSTAVAARWWRRPAWRWWQQLGESATAVLPPRFPTRCHFRQSCCCHRPSQCGATADEVVLPPSCMNLGRNVRVILSRLE